VISRIIGHPKVIIQYLYKSEREEYEPSALADLPGALEVLDSIHQEVLRWLEFVCSCQ
jgi:hypothetical protein